jgi:hypothetical protein
LRRNRRMKRKKGEKASFLFGNRCNPLIGPD